MDNINKILELGVINTLKINRDTPYGFFLEAQDGNEVLLPNYYITDDMQIDDIIDVFLYTDSEDRLVATTEFPIAFKNQFAFVKCVDTAPFGAFVDIGLPKDLLVPNNKQKTKFHKGDKRIIRIIEDEQTNRLIGVEKIKIYLNNNTKNLKPNQEVKILVMTKTPMGYKVIVDNQYEGMLYENEVFCKLFTGNKKTAYIKQVRADGKLDISLQPIGTKNNELAVEKIISLLEKNNGTLPYTSKSTPEEIQTIFNLSKKNFKKALTNLIEQNKIKSENGCISLIRE